MQKFLVSILLATLIFSSCKKQSFITGIANVSTSVDSLHFDTLFTTTGSVTKYFRIYNQNNQKLRISEVRLGGGSASAFKINVDGTPGPAVQDLEVEANDSLYVFVSVKIDPAAGDLPFVIQDSIHITFNGQERWVQLEAWGQNAHFLRSRLIAQDETWTNDKPYVILGGLQVDTNVTLTIEKGTRVYMHADAPIIVDGTLHVTGEHYDSTRVIFTGDRLDAPYRDYPAAWPGIYFRGSSIDNQLRYAIIKNAYQGIVAEKLPTSVQAKVTLRECIVDNCYDAGILGVNASISAENTLVSNCGKNIQLIYGGQYNFTHCTSVAYSSAFLQHKEPVLVVADYIRQNNNQFTANTLAEFRNCIFWADNSIVDNEVITQKQGTTIFNVTFENCLWKAKTNPANATITNVITNQDPAFESIDTQKRLYNFRLKEGSPALNKGITTSLSIDLDGKARPVGIPDLGCYEKQ